MTDDRQRRANSPITAFFAIVAVVLGVGALLVAFYRGIDLLLDSTAAPERPTTLSTTSTSATTTVTSAPAFDPGDFVTLTDDSGRLSLTVPSDWVDRSGTSWTVEGEEVGVAVSAAPDLDAWYSTWGTPGIFIGASDSGHVAHLDDFSQVCTVGNTAERAGGMLSGTVQVWTECGDEGGSFYVFAGSASEPDLEVLIQLVSIDGRGLSLLDEILTTVRYAP